MADIEKHGGDYSHLSNTTLHSFAWNDITVTISARNAHVPKMLLTDVNGAVKAGELLAIMGPSGCGKSTLLDVLARRAVASKATAHARVELNGAMASDSDFRHLSSFVEQEDVLIGTLTVRETLDFAARLSLPSSVSRSERLHRVNALLAAFGLVEQAGTLVGTPIRKGISGGQKRRLSIASQLITSPKLLLLDEPTSGLDSAASFEVMAFLRDIAKQYRLIVIASIHQPSTAVFNMFDQLLLLARGKTAYNSPVAAIQQHFEGLGMTMPLYTNPSEFLVDLINTDFANSRGRTDFQLDKIHSAYLKTPKSTMISADVEQRVTALFRSNLAKNNKLLVPLTLIHRSFIKSYRDVVAYGIRIVMYLGLAILMGTVWLRLSTSQDSIQSFINSIFFGGAFMSFMAVAYIPAFLEDRAIFVKERANGLYGPTSFMVANFVVGLPFLCVISLLFSVIAYWLTGFQPTASAFFTWVMWLYLDLLAAESLVVLISSIMPIFIVALAATAFANGLWMSVGGFLVPQNILNVFWRYVFHYIDYQAYVFQGMMVNEFSDRTYDCGTTCQCIYQTELASQCKLPGTAVLDVYGYGTGNKGKWVGIVLAIVLAYRFLGWIALYMRRT